MSDLISFTKRFLTMVKEKVWFTEQIRLENRFWFKINFVRGSARGKTKLF
jgi:hypothetical protein